MIVAVCVYNRFDNIKTWIDCWKLSNTEGSDLVIVHNFYGDQEQRQRFENYCKDNQVGYVPRNGPGFDIGAFQDVCKNRLPGFPAYDTLLWCCDDTIPMTRDFIKPFQDQLSKPGVGIACMEISPSVSVHVRTTGFALSKQTAQRLKFPRDPIVTKQDCYLFEHRGKQLTLMNQMTALGLKCIQVAPREVSPLWDQGYWKRLDRQTEHENTFGKMNKSGKIVFICPVYNMYPQIISSLICQTYKNWELLLIHNGPLNGMTYDIPKDDRIKFIIHPENTGHWGHYLRQWALNEIANERLAADAQYITITNADNYHTPSYCEYMLKGFSINPTAKAVYCSEMVHNYKAWQVIPCDLKLGYIDCAGVMVKKQVACEVGWKDVNGHSSDWTYFSDIIQHYGPRSFQKIKGCLLVHN